MPISKRLIFIFFTGIMMLGMLTFSTGHPVKSAVVIKPAVSTPDTGTPTGTEPDTTTPALVDNTPSVTEAPTPSAEPTLDPDAPNPLRLEIYPDVHDVIQQYFDAKTTCDIDTLKTLVTDPIYISAETITAQSEYVKGYSDIKCYTKRGGGEIDLVVYCTFNTTITTIETPIASLESFYITYKDDKPMIFSGIFSEETQALLTRLDNDDDVIALKESISEEIDKALQSDPALKDFWNKLINAVTEDAQSTDTETQSDEADASAEPSGTTDESPAEN